MSSSFSMAISIMANWVVCIPSLATLLATSNKVKTTDFSSLCITRSSDSNNTASSILYFLHQSIKLAVLSRAKKEPCSAASLHFKPPIGTDCSNLGCSNFPSSLRLSTCSCMAPTRWHSTTPVSSFVRNVSAVMSIFSNCDNHSARSSLIIVKDSAAFTASPFCNKGDTASTSSDDSDDTSLLIAV